MQVIYLLNDLCEQWLANFFECSYLARIMWSRMSDRINASDRETNEFCCKVLDMYNMGEMNAWDAYKACKHALKYATNN